MPSGGPFIQSHFTNSKPQTVSREEAQPEELYAQDDVSGHFPSHTRPNVQ